MKKHFKCLLSMLLVLTIFFNLFAFNVQAAGSTTTSSVTIGETTSYYKNLEDAGIYLRSQMKNRAETVKITLQTTAVPTTDWFDEIMDIAFRHTGVPNEGDYLRWNYAGCRGQFSYRISGSKYITTITYYMSYYTTAAQEKVMDTAVNTLITGLELNGKSDYEKIKCVYDYVCQNVTYDYEHLNDDNYTLKQSAYAALVNKKAVCQGYSLLLYRLLETIGFDCRIISGTSYGEAHAWNIVKLQNVYYNLDSTWDGGMHHYNYFLKGNTTFLNHTRDADYLTQNFISQYPMAAGDCIFKECSGHQWDSGTVTKTATTSETGIMTYTCTLCQNTQTASIPVLVKKANTITASNFTKTASSKKQSFSIGAKVKGNAVLTYKSDNKSVTVTSSGKVTISKNFSGKATITISSKETSTYKAKTKKITVTVKKKTQPLTVKSSATTLKASKTKKKSQTIKLSVSKAQGTVSYKSSNTKYVSVSKKGVITVKKGTPKGRYKITVTANGNSIYKSGSKTITITVK